MVLGFYTVGAHLLHFQIAKTFKLMSFELQKGEITPYYELTCGLEQALGCIQQLEAAVHSELQARLAA